jgi:predicted glycosyltransferase
MKVLFYFVHPSKFHLFKNTFEKLDQLKIEYDIVIINKDVLSDLLVNSGYSFIDIFPNGRSKKLPFFINAPINLFLTLIKLYRITRRKKYNLFISDDVISFIGKLTKTPTITFTDNDLKTIPKLKMIFKLSDYILAPTSTNLDEFESKKIGFKGPKAIAHLHPKYFIKNLSILEKYSIDNRKICIVRVAKLNASHDLIGNPGITDAHLETIINLIPKDYQLIISTERILIPDHQKYVLPILPDDFTHILAHAHFYIGDSTTMGIEAAVLGVPNIIINKVAENLGILKEMRDVNQISVFYSNFTDAKEKFIEMINNPSLKSEFNIKMEEFYNYTDDFNKILLDQILKFK